MDDSTRKSTVQLSIKTKNCLKQLGNKGDTYDQVICKLIKTVKKQINDQKE